MKHTTVCLLILIALLTPRNVLSQTLEIHQIDVGHGDAAVIVIRDVNLLSQRIQARNPALPVDSCKLLKIAMDSTISLQQTVLQAILIDAGSAATAGRVSTYLNSVGVTKIDYALTSHYHEDHIGGYAALTVPITHYIDRGTNHAPEVGSVKKRTIYGRYRDKVSTFTITHMDAPSDTSLPLVDTRITLQCIAVNDSVYQVDNTTPVSTDSENNYSMAWLLQYGPFSYLTCGDMAGPGCSSYVDGETRLIDGLSYIRKKTNPHICSMKISHHGSDCSTSENLLNYLQPNMCVIPCGKSSSFLPKKSTIDRISESRIEKNFYLTRLDSSILGLDPIGQPGGGTIGGNIVIIVDDNAVSNSKSESYVYHFPSKFDNPGCQKPNDAAIVHHTCDHDWCSCLTLQLRYNEIFTSFRKQTTDHRCIPRSDR